MQFKGRPFQKKVFALSFAAVFLSAVLHFCYGYMLFPDTVRLYTGVENKVDFGLSIPGIIDGESLTVLKINDSMPESGLELSFDEELTITAQEETSMDIQFTALGVPLKKVTVDVENQLEVIPCGMTAGVKIETDGVMVLGTGYVNGSDGIAHNPAEGILQAGDLILSVNGREVGTKEALRNEIKDAHEDIRINMKRDEDIMDVFITPVLCIEDNISKIGVWVRDSTQGIGTITYINPNNLKFGALGHGIMDVDTKQLMTIKSGEVTSADVHSIKKGKRGAPGEIIGDILMGDHFGEVRLNNRFGLYGVVEPDTDWLSHETIPVASQSQVVEGPAIILSNIGSDLVEEYDVIIETVNKYSADDSKGMVIRITDEKLLEMTNGIVQGMSGSPIIQDGRLVGAVTHVFVQDPAKGYGIFIENMLNQESGF